MGEYIMALLLVLLVSLIFVSFVMIPIMIANARGITGAEKTTIVILSWLGIFFGITWLAALILSLVWGGSSTGDNLDKLEKLSKLYKSKVITKAEYEKMKAKLMRE